jgi:hypothetical protein
MNFKLDLPDDSSDDDIHIDNGIQNEPSKRTTQKTIIGDLMGQGSFGQVYRVKGGRCLKTGKWKSQMYTPSCVMMQKLADELLDAFPKHFPTIFSCLTEEELSTKYEITMQCIDDAIPFIEYLKNPDNRMLLPIYAQIYYILHVMNDKMSIFHNDMAHRNIMISNTTIESAVLDQHDECMLQLRNVPRIYIIDLDFLLHDFINYTDCIPVNGEKCTRDIDTLEIPSIHRNVLDKLFLRKQDFTSDVMTLDWVKDL